MLRDIGLGTMSVSIIAFVILRVTGALRWELPSRIVRGDLPSESWPTETNFYTNWPAIVILTVAFVVGLVCVLLPDKPR